MVKILLLTKFSPSAVSDVCVMLTESMGSVVFPNSPVLIAQMTSEAKDVSFFKTFYPALNIYNRRREETVEYAKEHGFSTVITVGTDVHNSWDWYDAVIGYNDPKHPIPDVAWAALEEEFNEHGLKIIKLKSADVIFDTKWELLRFIEKTILIKGEQKKNEI